MAAVKLSETACSNLYLALQPISLSTRTVQALFTLADLLLPKQLLAMTLSTLARLATTASEKVRTNKLPAIVSVLVGMALRSEKPQNHTMSVVHLLVLSALKG